MCCLPGSLWGAELPRAVGRITGSHAALLMHSKDLLGTAYVHSEQGVTIVSCCCKASMPRWRPHKLSFTWRCVP